MMHEFVMTHHGFVTVDSDERGVVVRVDTPRDLVTEVRHEENSDVVTLFVSFSERPPHKGMEVTQNGSTFEVLDVRKSGSGYDVLNGNTGAWERYES